MRSYVKCTILLLASLFICRSYATPHSRTKSLIEKRDFGIQSSANATGAGGLGCNSFCPYGNNPDKPKYGWCHVQRFDEEISKYYGICFNKEADEDGAQNLTTLPAQYATEALEFLAYYTLDSPHSYCAGKDTIQDSHLIGCAQSGAAYYTQIALTTAYDIWHGVSSLVGNSDFQPNMAHKDGIVWASLHYVAPEVWHINNAVTYFLPSDPGEFYCDEKPGPEFLPMNSAGYASGQCGMVVNQWASSIDNFPIPFTVVLSDANNFVIGWQNMTSTIDPSQPINVDSKLPTQMVVALQHPLDDFVTWTYGSEHDVCNFGPYENDPEYNQVGKRSCNVNFPCADPSSGSSAKAPEGALVPP